jgi:hypothetical protein
MSKIIYFFKLLIVLILFLETIEYSSTNWFDTSQNYFIYFQRVVSQLEIGLLLAFLLYLVKKILSSTLLKGYTKVLLFNLTIVAVIFLVGELMVRWLYVPLNILEATGVKAGDNQIKKWGFEDAYSGYVAKPMATKNQDGKTVNRFGFISTPDLSEHKKKRTIRIAFIGGSSTAAGRLSDEETWPYKTTALIRASYKERDVEYINAALGGYTSFESYGRFWSRVRLFEPDIVVVNHGWNDMYYFGKADELYKWRNGIGDWGVGAKMKSKKYEPFKIDVLIVWSQLLTRVRLLITDYEIDGSKEEFGFRRKNVVLEKSYNKKGLDVFRTNMKLFQSTADLLQMKIFFCKQPTLIAANISDEVKSKCRYEYHGFDHKAHLDAFNEIYRILDQEIPANYLIDLRSMSGNDSLFNDHIHPNEKGTSAYAEIVGDSLVNYMKREY